MTVFVAFPLNCTACSSLQASIVFVATEGVVGDKSGARFLKSSLDTREQYDHNICCTYLRHRVVGITSNLLLVMRMNLSITEYMT